MTRLPNENRIHGQWIIHNATRDATGEGRFGGEYELIRTLDLPTQLPTQAIPRESLTKRVANKLKEGILIGDYALGQRLVEAELGARFGVSSSVIREALYTLQGEGLAVADAYRGRSVYSLDEAEARELVVLRTSQESLAAFLAAEKLNEEGAERIAEAAALMQVSQAYQLRRMGWARARIPSHGLAGGAP